LAIRRQGIYSRFIHPRAFGNDLFLCLEAPFTHGEDGIQSVPQGRLLASSTCPTDDPLLRRARDIPVRLSRDLSHHHSPFGDILKAITARTSRAPFRRLPGRTIQVAAFVLSATLAGLARGPRRSLLRRLADRRAIAMSGEVVLMTLLGGHGTIFGPVSRFRSLCDAAVSRPVSRPVGDGLQGSIFVVCVLVFRRGIVGEVGGRVQKIAVNRPVRRFFACRPWPM